MSRARVVVLDEDAVTVIVAALRHADGYYRTRGTRPPRVLFETLEALAGHERPTRDERAGLADAVVEPPAAVTFAEAARRLSCSERTVRRMCSDGRLSTIRLGRARRVPVAELDRLTTTNPEA